MPPSLACRKMPPSSRNELSAKLRFLADALEHHFTACAGDDELMELARGLREVAARTEANPTIELELDDIEDIEEHVTWLEERVAQHKETCHA